MPAVGTNLGASVAGPMHDGDVPSVRAAAHAEPFGGTTRGEGRGHDIAPRHFERAPETRAVSAGNVAERRVSIVATERAAIGAQDRHAPAEKAGRHSNLVPSAEPVHSPSSAIPVAVSSNAKAEGPRRSVPPPMPADAPPPSTRKEA